MGVCGACAAENPDGKRFCRDCGRPLALTCPGCGAAVDLDQRFCGDCGAPQADPRPAAPAAVGRAEGPGRIAERRLTTVLFADLVGFTTISEARDSEDVRELLSRYFAMAGTVVGRYGGTIEKFIGDAVMAVWGVPVAHEDDAERAVRAGLDLVSGLVDVADAAGVPDLGMRVGILTGEVAVTIGALGEGMVAGDAVNTAARIQAAAARGEVWVDEVTRSLTSAAVTYTDAGDHPMKGKAEPVRLHVARAIVASVGGAQRVDGLEAPFVGRGHELRMVKEVFHAALDEERPRLVAVTGLAGVGKTRLAWEFEKYVDGISAGVRWHRSRVLSYGDGVSFWAVAEMVRARLGVVEGDAPGAVLAKLDVWLGQAVGDPGERARLRPRLGVLLGLDVGDGDGFGRDDLFAAWASFFEHVREEDKGVVLVFDDMHHADPDLLDFLDLLLETARYGLFVLSLARPELLDARPGWGRGRRATTVYLEPLGEAAMVEIVHGLVGDLPGPVAHALVERSEGIPLYALEVVRGLIDRDAVVPHEGRYVLAPDADQRVDLAALDAPPSLQALIAARLDALTPDERHVVQDASVHGLAFSRDGLEFVTEVADLGAVLEELVRKQVLEVQTDRFSAERGQYRFLQALVRSVAYETLSRRDRKRRHLAVARYLQQSSAGDEVAAIVARHLLDALDSGPDDDDAGELAGLACAQLARAGRRAEALGSPDEALRHYTAALARQADADERAVLLEGAARAARSSGRPQEAIHHAEQARTAYEAAGRPIDAGRALAVVGAVQGDLGHHRAALELMGPVYEQLLDVPGADETVLELAEVLAWHSTMSGDPVAAQPYADRALELAEAREDWERVVSLLGRHAVIWLLARRPTGALALMRAAVDLGHRHRMVRPLIQPLLNTAAFQKNRDLGEAAAAARESLDLAIKAGALEHRHAAVANVALVGWVAGSWDEVLEVHEQYGEAMPRPDATMLRLLVSLIQEARDEPVEGSIAPPGGGAALDAEGYGRHTELLLGALEAEAAGEVDRAVVALGEAMEATHELSGIDDDFAVIWPFVVERLLAHGAVAEAARHLALVGDAPPGLVTPLAHALHVRLRALVGMASGADDATVDADLEEAVVALRAFGARYDLGRTLVALAGRVDDEAAEPLLHEAREIFGSLRATRWLRELSTAAAGRD